MELIKGTERIEHTSTLLSVFRAAQLKPFAEISVRRYKHFM